MARTLDESYERVLELLPDGWKITSLTQDSAGWVARASKVTYTGPGDQTWYPSVGARAGGLIKALNRLADKLEENASS